MALKKSSRGFLKVKEMDLVKKSGRRKMGVKAKRKKTIWDVVKKGDKYFTKE
jgi:hypothetical protein